MSKLNHKKSANLRFIYASVEAMSYNGVKPQSFGHRDFYWEFWNLSKKVRESRCALKSCVHDTAIRLVFKVSNFSAHVRAISMYIQNLHCSFLWDFRCAVFLWPVACVQSFRQPYANQFLTILLILMDKPWSQSDIIFNIRDTPINSHESSLKGAICTILSLCDLLAKALTTIIFFEGAWASVGEDHIGRKLACWLDITPNQHIQK